jgi:acyl-coenzyme A synthetase/AMP-(fatty) acid ligase
MATVSPLRNLRGLLSLHATVTPDLRWITLDSQAYTFAEVNALVHQTAGWLYETRGVRPDHVLEVYPHTLNLPLIAFAGWMLGASLRFSDHGFDAEQIIPAQVETLPNTFVSSPYRATLETPALHAENRTHGDLIACARELALALNLTGNQRVYCSLHDPALMLSAGVITPLIAGAAVILHSAFSADSFWRTLAYEQAQIALITPAQVALLVAHSREHPHAIWGAHAAKIDFRRFRFCVCVGDSPDFDVLRTFEDTFAFPMLTSFTHHGLITALMPHDLAWEERRALQYRDHSVGTPILSDMPTQHMRTTQDSRGRTLWCNVDADPARQT